MRWLRILVLATVAAAGFYYFTTYPGGGEPLSPARWAGAPAPLEVTEAAGPQQLDAEEQNNITLYKRVLPAVVNITSTSLSFDFFYGVVPEQGAGSGFVIDKEGHILTNYHVIANARQVEVTLSNRKKYKAEVIGSDRSHDLAIIKISAPNLQSVTLGDSSKLQVGQKVYAIGNPFGMFSGTMTRGIVSSIRSIREPDGVFIDEAIQTDAAINPGNSGGPLLNSHGEVIGINTMIAGTAGQSAGIGFAIPVNTAKAVLNDLVTFGRVKRPSLGFRSLPIGPELAAQIGLPVDYGVLIITVVPGGAAERAGLRGGSERAYIGNIPIMLGGDLIVAIDGQEIVDQQDLSHVMNNHRAGDSITLTIYRGKRKMDVKVTLGEAREQV